MEDKRSLKLLGRRETISLLGVGLAAGGLFGLAACNKDKEAPAGGGGAPSPQTTPQNAPTPGSTGAPGQALTCDTPFDAASKQSRMIMQYKNPAAVPEKHCSACSQYIPAKFGDCGGCKLFGGPVNPNGGCLSFAPLDPNAAPAKSG